MQSVDRAGLADSTGSSQRGRSLAARAIIFPMPPPRYDRQALEQERDVEIPAQIADYQRELDATPIEFTERRERLEW
jgi:hypothetical protein